MSRWFSSFRVKPSVEACTGPHTVGCTDFMCGPQITQTGSANGNKQGPDHGTFVRLFYPALPSNCGEEIEQDKVAWMPLREYVDGMISFMKLPAWLLGGAFHWLIGEPRLPILLVVCTVSIRKSRDSRIVTKDFFLCNSQYPCYV